jgi:hypothetical protein
LTDATARRHDAARDPHDATRYATAQLHRHYPERVVLTLLVNAPPHFAAVWSLVAPLLEPRVRERVVVCRGGSWPAQVGRTRAVSRRTRAVSRGDIASCGRVRRSNARRLSSDMRRLARGHRERALPRGDIA